MKNLLLIAAILFAFFQLSFAQDAFVNPSGVCGGGVPCFTTIQAAVDAASPGDVIEVENGTYIENVLISKSLTLLSTNGRASTTIQGVDNASLGTVQIQSTSNVQVGGIGSGFTILGINGNGAIENAAVYLQGNVSSISIIDNEIIANGDGGLLSEFAATVDNITIDGNEFSGQTYVDPLPGGCGFATQFNPGNNVPRQLVTIGGGTGGGNTSNIIFTNNEITGTAGDGSPAAVISCPNFGQGNTLVTIDAQGATISGNTFAGTTARFGTMIRARGTNTEVFDNTFEEDGLGPANSIGFFNNGPGSSLGGQTPTLEDVANMNIFPDTAWILENPMSGDFIIYGTEAAAQFNADPGQGVNSFFPPITASIPTMGQWATFLFGLLIFTISIVVVYNLQYSRKTNIT